MRKTKKVVYYPTMMYYPVRMTKKRSKKDDFNYKYARNFKPQDLMKPPKKKINFRKTDNVNKFVGNILDLYNIDYNPQFLDISLNSFDSKIKEYLGIIRQDDFYLNSVGEIKKNSDIVELRTVLNEHELHLIIESLDLLLEFAKNNKRQFSSNIRKNVTRMLKNTNPESSKKLQKTLQQGGGYVRKFDIVAFLNGDKRNSIKSRICDFIYYSEESKEKIDEPSNIKLIIGDIKDKVESGIKHNETFDPCFDAFLQQKILPKIKKGNTAYDDGQFDHMIDNCRVKDYFYPGIRKLYYGVARRKGVKEMNKKEKKDKEDYKKFYTSKKFIFEKRRKEAIEKFDTGSQPLNDKFEYTNGLSMINIGYLESLFNNTQKVEEREELIELIEAFHELQIPDSPEARNKEKKMKDYLSNISFAIAMMGMLPPEFFGEDADYNPFDVLSTIMCIFEGSTVCAVMSALPLFSPLLDALSTISYVRKLLRKFGVKGAMGKRSKAAIKKFEADELAKMQKKQEAVAQLETNIHIANQNLKKAEATGTFKEVRKLKDELKDLSKQKFTQQKNALEEAKKEMAKTLKDGKKYLDPKNQNKIFKKVREGETLTSKEKYELLKMKEYQETVKNVFEEGAKRKIKMTDSGLTPDLMKTQFKKLDEVLTNLGDNYSDATKKIFDLGARNSKFTTEGLDKLEDGMKKIEKLNGGPTPGVYPPGGKMKDSYKAAADTYQDAKYLQDLAKRASGGSVEITANVRKQVEKVFPDKPIPKDGKITFTPEEMATINKSVTDKLGQAGNPLLANKIKITEKKIKFMDAGDFGLDELSYLQRTHGGTFSDVSLTTKRLEDIEKITDVSLLAMRKKNLAKLEKKKEILLSKQKPAVERTSTFGKTFIPDNEYKLLSKAIKTDELKLVGTKDKELRKVIKKRIQNTKKTQKNKGLKLANNQNKARKITKKAEKKAAAEAKKAAAEEALKKKLLRKNKTQKRLQQHSTNVYKKKKKIAKKTKKKYKAEKKSQTLGERYSNWSEKKRLTQEAKVEFNAQIAKFDDQIGEMAKKKDYIQDYLNAYQGQIKTGTPEFNRFKGMLTPDEAKNIIKKIDGKEVGLNVEKLEDLIKMKNKEILKIENLKNIEKTNFDRTVFEIEKSFKKNFLTDTLQKSNVNISKMESQIETAMTQQIKLQKTYDDSIKQMGEIELNINQTQYQIDTLNNQIKLNTTNINSKNLEISQLDDQLKQIDNSILKAEKSGLDPNMYNELVKQRELLKNGKIKLDADLAELNFKKADFDTRLFEQNRDLTRLQTNLDETNKIVKTQGAELANKKLEIFETKEILRIEKQQSQILTGQVGKQKQKLLEKGNELNAKISLERQRIKSLNSNIKKIKDDAASELVQENIKLRKLENNQKEVQKQLNEVLEEQQKLINEGKFVEGVEKQKESIEPLEKQLEIIKGNITNKGAKIEKIKITEEAKRMAKEAAEAAAEAAAEQEKAFKLVKDAASKRKLYGDTGNEVARIARKKEKAKAIESIETLQKEKNLAKKRLSKLEDSLVPKRRLNELVNVEFGTISTRADLNVAAAKQGKLKELEEARAYDKQIQQQLDNAKKFKNNLNELNLKDTQILEFRKRVDDSVQGITNNLKKFNAQLKAAPPKAPPLPKPAEQKFVLETLSNQRKAAFNVQSAAQESKREAVQLLDEQKKVQTQVENKIAQLKLEKTQPGYSTEFVKNAKLYTQSISKNKRELLEQADKFKKEYPSDIWDNLTNFKMIEDGADIKVVGKHLEEIKKMEGDKGLQDFLRVNTPQQKKILRDYDPSNVKKSIFKINNVRLKKEGFSNQSIGETLGNIRKKSKTPDIDEYRQTYMKKIDEQIINAESELTKVKKATQTKVKEVEEASKKVEEATGNFKKISSQEKTMIAKIRSQEKTMIAKKKARKAAKQASENAMKKVKKSAESFDDSVKVTRDNKILLIQQGRLKQKLKQELIEKEKFLTEKLTDISTLIKSTNGDTKVLKEQKKAIEQLLKKGEVDSSLLNKIRRQQIGTEKVKELEKMTSEEFIKGMRQKNQLDISSALDSSIQIDAFDRLLLEYNTLSTQSKLMDESLQRSRNLLKKRQEYEKTVEALDELEKLGRLTDKSKVVKTSAAKALDTSAAKAVDTSLLKELKNIEYEKALLKPKDNLELIQNVLEVVASSYLVQNNVENKLEAIKDNELDKRFYFENNEAFSKVMGLEGEKILGQMSSLLAPTGFGNLVTLVSAMKNTTKIFDPGKNAKAKKDAILQGRSAKITEKTKNKTDLLTGKKLVPYENESFNVFSNDKRTNEMSQFLEKKFGKVELPNEKEFNKSNKGNKTSNKGQGGEPNEEKIELIIPPDEELTPKFQEYLKRRETKQQNEEAGYIDPATLKQSLNDTYMNPEELSGGGKKKELLMRNEIFSDDRLSKELDKFSYEFKTRTEEFNEPLKQLLTKRSNYRIKQKMSLKEEHLQMYRAVKNETEGYEKEVKEMEFSTFQKMNESFKNEKKKIFEGMLLLSKNSFTQNTVEIGTYYETQKLIVKFEGIEEKINQLMKNPEIEKFRDNFDKLLKKIYKQENIVKKTNIKVQDFKAKDEDFDREEEILKNLLKNKEEYVATTKEEKEYKKLKDQLKVVQKEIDNIQIFVNMKEKLKKEDLSVESFVNIKNGLFQRFRTKIVEEIDFIKNEFDIATFLSLPINEIKQLSLLKYLQEIYVDIVRFQESLKIVNEKYRKENLKVNKEIESAKEQLKFYYKNLSQIKLNEDKILFIKRFQNREKNLKLLMEIQNNIFLEFFENQNFISKCGDMMVFCDFQINTVKNSNTIQETKSLLLSDKQGLIDISELHENQDSIDIKTNPEEIVDILNIILRYLQKINRSRKLIFKTIQDKYVKMRKLNKKKKNTKDKKEIKRLGKQIFNLRQKILSYRFTNKEYSTLENPLFIMIFYGILEEKVGKKTTYKFNKEILDLLEIKVTKEMNNKLEEINKFILEKKLD